MNININDDVLFSNFSYNPEVYYFLYIGEIKAYGINILLQEMFSQQLVGREVQFIAIVSDIFGQYDFENIIVITPLIVNPIKPAISRRTGAAEFMTAVSKSPTVRNLITTILHHQDILFINLWESIKEMTLDEIDGVKIIGPDKKLAQKFNNKITQYQLLDGIVPLADFCFCEDSQRLLETADSLKGKWTNGIFVSCAYSAAGSNSAKMTSQQQVAEWCKKQQGPFLVSRYLPHVLDPTVLAVVANKDQVYIAGIADQIITNSNRFIGSTYPSIISKEQRKQLNNHTTTIGKILGSHGYRGIFGCDYIIDFEGQIFLVEINARKQGTTLEFCYTLAESLPKGAPTLPELEFFSVMENRFPDHTTEPKSIRLNLHWGTNNVKLSQQQRTSRHIPHNKHERRMFHEVALGKLQKDFAILDHVGANFEVMEGTFLARIVSVATNRADMEEGLRLGNGFVQQTLDGATG